MYDGLPLCNVGDVVSDAILLQRWRDKCGKHHYSKIVQHDRDSLHPHQLMNDINGCQGTVVIRPLMRFFTSHFYSVVSNCTMV